MVATKKTTKKKKTTKTKDKTPPKLYYCSGCGQEKPRKDFYSCYTNPNSEILPFCKDCCVEKSLDSFSGQIDITNFKEMLQRVDRPYLHDYFVNNCKKSDNPRGIIGLYFKDLGLKQNRPLQYKDSLFDPNIDSLDNLIEELETDEKIEEELKNNEMVLNKAEMKRLRLKWGGTFNKRQIEKLEDFYNKMLDAKPDKPTPVDEDYMIKSCKTSLLADEALEKGNAAQYEKYMNILNTINKSLKLTAVQRNATDNVGGLATFGEFIAKCESEGFIEPAKVEEDYDIVEKTIHDIVEHYRRLVRGDSSIQTMVDEYGEKLRNKQLEEDEDNVDEEEPLEIDGTDTSEYDEVYYV